MMRKIKIIVISAIMISQLSFGSSEIELLNLIQKTQNSSQQQKKGVDPETLIEGNIPIRLSRSRLKAISEFFRNSKASLEKLRKEAQGFDINKANNQYRILIQKIVQKSYKLTNGAHAEFFMRVALNQGLALTSAYYILDKKGNPVLKPGLLRKASNPILKRVIIEDSIALAIQYFQEADQVLATECLENENCDQSYDEFGQFASDRLLLASIWTDSVLEEGYRARFLKKILEQWLQVVLVDENLKDSKFGNEALLVSDAFEKIKLYKEDLGAQERILREALKSVLESLQQNPAVKSGRFSSAVAIESQMKEMKFVSLPGGSFQMGCTDDSSGCDEDEKPVHEVTLSPFEIMTTEVTQGMWKSVMGDNPSFFISCGESCPVESVSWDEVQGFIAKMNEKNDGYLYRLPTEAEWEYAARAGCRKNYSSTDKQGNPVCSNEVSVLNNSGWYDGNSEDKTHPVAQKNPNQFGLYDMHGNVWEWVSDWYERDYYSKSVKKNPSGPSGGSYRVLRGGSWFYPSRYVRSGNRGIWKPSFHSKNVGFRLARTQ
ncbi:MAG: hypothetical protein CL678_16605 [Bdellovibrionaceae bacterium]|nr:hypothetical protein [Pseudobdellovibrionaceae bacterium]